MKHPNLRALALVATIAAPALLAGCDESARVKSLEGEVTALDAQVKKLEGERDKLSARLEAAERRMGGLQQDLLAVRRSADAAADAATSASEKEPAVDGAQVAGNPSAQSAAAGAVDPKTSQAAQELEALLSTDAGRTVFEGAMRRVEQKRDEERSARMVTGLVDAFAQRANLTPEQSEQMKKVVGKTFTEIGALWRTSGEGEMTPEQRAQKRQEVFAKAEEIRKTTEEEVKTILNVEQFEMFQQESARMRGFIDGGAGGFGGRGGRGYNR